MKTIINDNFLNGKLFIKIFDEEQSVYGYFEYYDEYDDEIYYIEATAKCAKGDNWSEKTGIDIVESKIVRAYHKSYMNDSAEFLRQLKYAEKVAQEEYEFRKQKVLNIEKNLNERYGLTYWRKDTKRSKKTSKTTKTKTTK